MSELLFMGHQSGHGNSNERQGYGTTSTNQDEAEQLLPRNFDSSDVVSCQRDHAAAPQITLIQPVGSEATGPQTTANAVDTFSISSSAAGSANTWAAICVCGAHGLARWGWRTWEFAVALILIKLFPTSLLLVSIFGLLDNLVRLMFGAAIGQYVDRTERLQGALTCYAIQNICIATSAAGAAALLLLDAAEQGRLPASHPAIYWSLISVTLLAGASSSIGSLGAAVAVEREYAKTLCGGDSVALAQLNAGMRAIDLMSQMLGPVASGLLMSYSSMLVAVVVLVGYSLAAWLPEAWLLAAAHRYSHRLRQPKPMTSDSQLQPKRQSALRVLLGGAGWATYFKQQVLLPGLALSVLYLTVLSLGFMMTSFLAWQGLSEATISLFRSAGALSGLMATVLFHPLQRCGVSLVGAAGLGITWQLVCLLAGVVPIVVAQVLAAGTVTTLAHDSAAAVPAATQLPGKAADQAGTLPVPLLYALLTGLVLSRFGLWLFDLAISQLQQELVPQSELGTVSGAQASLQSAFEITSFLAGTAISDPRQFHWLMAGSCTAVATGAVLFYTYAWKAGRRSPDVVTA